MELKGGKCILVPKKKKNSEIHAHEKLMENAYCLKNKTVHGFPKFLHQNCLLIPLFHKLFDSPSSIFIQLSLVSSSILSITAKNYSYMKPPHAAVQSMGSRFHILTCGMLQGTHGLILYLAKCPWLDVEQSLLQAPP